MGWDPHYGFQLYQSDPSGNYGGWKATCIGNNHPVDHVGMIGGAAAVRPPRPPPPAGSHFNVEAGLQGATATERGSGAGRQSSLQDSRQHQTHLRERYAWGGGAGWVGVCTSYVRECMSA